MPLSTTGSSDNTDGMISWLSDDMSQIDAAQADKQYHTSPPLLQANEVCEMAFKGRRNLVLFTTNRILVIDKKGWSGKKMAFTTIPYSSIKVFQVTTAGSIDRDCEFGIFTEIWFDPGDEPAPGMSYIEFDVNRHTTDILGIHRYVSAKVHNLSASSNSEIHPDIPSNETIDPSPPGAVDKFLNFFGQDFTQMDPQQIEASLGIDGEFRCWYRVRKY